MRNKLLITYIISFFFIFINFKAFSDQQFNFEITEIEILEEGNLFKGNKRGKIVSDNGILIKANNFTYNKSKNILNANGKVIIEDLINKYQIFSDEIKYFKNQDLIITNGNSKAIDDNKKIITSKIFEYDRQNNIINAKDNVTIEDELNKYKLFTNDITYKRNFSEIISNGNTNLIVENKYNIKSKNVTFYEKEKIIKSKYKTQIKDNNSKLYNIENFSYSINNQIIKGENITIVTNFNLPKSDKFVFSSGIINLNNSNFIAKDTEILIHNTVFGNNENEPRLKGVSSKKINELTTINKGIFTSCKNNDKCPPWSIKAEKIVHDKANKKITYDNSVLKIYDIPVFYFPKFFHPDPTVDRQSGFLQPRISNSNILGNSFTLPYYNVISSNKDNTFSTTIFDENTQMFQNEFRQKNKNSNFIADLGYVNNFKSNLFNKKKNISHLFAKYNLDLDLNNFQTSDLSLSVEKVTNDSYLKVFNSYFNEGSLTPKNEEILKNDLKLNVENESFTFSGGTTIFENLKLNNSDRYQYILPYYDFNRSFDTNLQFLNISFNSSGSNNLNETNIIKSKIINDLYFNSIDFFTDSGFKNNLNFNLKNLNTVGKNSTEYKSNPEVELLSNIEFRSSLPLIKKDYNHNNLLIPKFSLKYSPSDMKNYADDEKIINVNNIFHENRLGLDDSFEAGKSLTVGLDYKKTKTADINKYFEFKLATTLRDKEENLIPKTSTLNRKHSNLFGSIKNNFSENIQLDYNFSIDNNFNTFEKHDLNTIFTLNNLVTEFNFLQETGEIGDTDVLENKTTYAIDENNFISFKTRRNRSINLTEYYNLVYEYKNDCLTAGIKYNKTYYEDRELKPEEDILFTLTLFPITSYEQKVNYD